MRNQNAIANALWIKILSDIIGNRKSDENKKRGCLRDQSKKVSLCAVCFQTSYIQNCSIASVDEFVD